MKSHGEFDQHSVAIEPLAGHESRPPLISVVILNWNGQRLLGDCLEALRRQTFRDFEILVVDNGSTDDSVAFVRREFPEARVLPLEKNYGFCAGNNLGVKASQGQYVFFLNNDTECECAMLEELNHAIQNDPSDVGSWATKMLRWNDRRIVDNRGCGYSAFGTGYQIGAGEIDEATSAIDEWIFGASGGAGCYRRSVLDDIGLFDEDFFFNNEDVDLSFRSQLAGYRCHFVPKAIVYHHGSATSGIASDISVYHIHRNKEWVFLKNMPARLLWKYLLPHLCYSLGWVFYWIIKGKAKVILRAKRDALREWRTVLTKRRQIQSSRRTDLEHIDTMIDKQHVLRVWHSRSFVSFLPKRKTPHGSLDSLG